MNTLLDNGFGTASKEQLDTLLKALQGGDYNVAPTSLVNGAALQTESLDSTLRSVTFDMKKLVLWPMIAKDKAYNLNEEYNRQTSYGESNNGGFFDANSGTAPDERTAAYNRQQQKIAYIGDKRIVTHPLTLVAPAHGPIIAGEIKNSTVWILSNLERQLYEANGHFQTSTGRYTGAIGDVPTGSAKFNGIDQQVRSGQVDATAQFTGWEAYGGVKTPVKDLAGAAPTGDDIEDLALTVLDNHGMPDSFHMDHATHSALSKLFYPKERINSPGVSNGKAGYVLSEFVTSAGIMKLAGNVFLRPKKSPLAVAQTGAPAMPVITSTGVEADTDTSLAAATYYYKASAINNKGESVATAAEDQIVAANERATVVIAAGTAGAIYYAVYRAAASTGTYLFIGYVKDVSAGGGGGATFRDAGKKEPGCATGYMLSTDVDNLVWKQLAPLMKMDLAITGPAFQWMQLLYGTPIVPAPLHNGIMDNIGIG